MNSSTLPDKVKSALRLVHDLRSVWKVQAISATDNITRDAVYSNFRVVGNGSFGVVCAAKDMQSGQDIAIKIVFQDRRYKNRELQIMKALFHQNVVRLKEYFYKVDEKTEDEVYLHLILEFMPDTIFNTCQSYIKHKQLMPHLHIKLYMYQLLRALGYIHSQGICHRDIKPQNLLLNPATGVVKLCDFGSAKQLVAGEVNVSYICSRYYRAPELLLGSTEYTTAVDIWSTGCVMAELMIGSPIFPGNTDIDQIVQIIKVLGTPTKAQILGMNPKAVDYKFPTIQACSLQQLFPANTPKTAIELLGKLLAYVPNQRYIALEALTHPYFDELRDPNTVYAVGRQLPPLFDFTEQELASHPDLITMLIPAHANPAVKRGFLMTPNSLIDSNDGKSPCLDGICTVSNGINSTILTGHEPGSSEKSSNPR